MTVPAHNAVFGFPNLVDAYGSYTPTFSGGTWTATMPQTNLQTRYLSERARTVGVTTAATQTDIDFGRAMSARLLGLAGHNLSQNGKVRFRTSNTAATFTSPIYDSGWLEAWPAIYPLGTLPVGHPSWFSGRLSTDEIALYPFPLLKDMGRLYTGRYLRVEVDDTANPAGYVEIGRIIFAPGFQLSINLSYGHRLGLDSSTQGTETDGGAMIYDERATRGTQRFSVNSQTEDFALVQSLDLQRRAGKAKQTVFLYDPTDTVHMNRRGMLGCFRTLGEVEAAFYNGMNSSFELIEEI